MAVAIPIEAWRQLKGSWTEESLREDVISTGLVDETYIAKALEFEGIQITDKAYEEETEDVEKSEEDEDDVVSDDLEDDYSDESTDDSDNDEDDFNDLTIIDEEDLDE